MATYSFQDVAATLVGVGGVVSLGYGAGAAEEGITISYNEDKNTMTIGADGSAMHSLHAGKSATVTIRLLKTSPTNARLAVMYAAQTISSAAHGQNVLTISDTARGDAMVGRSVAFKKFTGLTYAKDAGMNEWAFDVGKLDGVLGVGTPAL